MYPTISDFLLDFLGLNLPLPIQTFGFMLAVSFFLAAYTLKKELLRKEKAGLLHYYVQTVEIGKPTSLVDLASSALTGFLIGFKLVYVIFHYSEFVNDTQGVLLSLKGNTIGGVLIGVLMAYIRYREGEKNKLPEVKVVQEQVWPHQLVMNITFTAAISGIIGAKLFHNLENWNELVENPMEALLSFSGLTMYGGLIFGTVAVIYMTKKYGIAPLHIADAAAPGVMLAYGTGRLGCQLAGDGDWGIVNLSPKPNWMSFLPDWFWSYNYPHNVISSGVPMEGCYGRHCMMLPQPVYPTPLYEAIICIALFFVIWSVRKRIVKPGVLFSLYLLLNGLERLVIEQIRINNKINFLGIQPTQAEIIASCLILLGVSGLFIFNNKTNETD
ncbi:MAG: prolipoprotein diacylglyceryl transferase [Bacteroidota bacterium]